MAIINKMRKSGWVFIVILAALALFVLSDLISGFQNQSGVEDPIVGEIGGVSIRYSEYDEVYKNRLANKEQSNEGKPLTDSDRKTVSNDAWDDLFRKHVVAKEYKKLGITASKQELHTLLFTDDAHMFVQQYFANPEDPQNPFSGANVINWYRQVYPTNPEAQIFFNSLKDAVVSSVQSDKYRAMIQKGIHVTGFDVLNDYMSQARTVTGEAFGLQLDFIEDSEVDVTDAELKQYYNANKEEFKLDETRDIEYVSWTVIPSSYDSMDIKQMLLQDIPLFESAENDSAFATVSSERDVFIGYRAASELPVEYATDVLNAEAGTVLGPYTLQNAYAIVKVVDQRESEVTRYKYKHFILNREWDTREDSLAQVAQARDFVTFINDMGVEAAVEEARARGYLILGDLEGNMPWTEEEGLDPSFAPFIVGKSKGQTAVQGTSQGINVFYIEENPSNKEVIAIEIYKDIVPSMATINQNYALASQFRAALSDGANNRFEEAIQEAGYAKRVATEIYRNNSKIPGFDDASELTRWLFEDERKRNEISEVLTVDDRQVVVHITNLTNEGIGAFEQVKEQVKAKVIEDKKRVMLVEKIEKALPGKETMAQLAISFQKVAFDYKSLGLKGESFQAARDEPRVHGAAVAMPVNIMSKPIVAENGVYVVMNKSAEQPQVPQDLDSRKPFIHAALFQTLEFKVVAALKGLANIEDNRSRYFN